MTDDKDNIIKNLQKKISKLEATLKIVTSYSGKTETRMREQFEVVAETITVPMIISKENGKTVFANLNAQKTFGYYVEDFVGVEASSLYYNQDEWNLFLKSLSKRGEVSGFRVELKTSKGTIFPAVLFSHRIYFDGQNCILTIIHDLTEVMALEKQLRQTQKLEAIGTLAGGIAHDFNNILAAIFGYTELTINLLDPKMDIKKKEYLNNVLKAAGRAKSMIMQMMGFCRHAEQEKKPFLISAITAEVVKMMTSLTPSNIDIRSNIRNKSMVVTGDPTQIHQVMTNLITNAVHALSGKGGMIEVLLDKTNITEEQRDERLVSKLEPGIYAKITVKDNGPGIDQDMIHSIFDPFFTTKPVGEGSGMGLAMVHGIILGHGGSVGVKSEDGKGTAFHCYFPVSRDNSATASPHIESKRAEKGNERILLVDDDSMVLDINIQILKAIGYKVVSCTRAMKALTIFKTRPKDFDLVVTDNFMPEMSGIKLIKEIKKIRSDIPVILVSGTLSKNEIELKKTGITATIQKPFGRKEIQFVIRKVLDAAKKSK
ncbi:ATP-binding protein [Desulfobacterales bacterium HSG16]|nr:ATP-binding protein [Desulfobacterales bacterium HSG16]